MSVSETPEQAAALDAVEKVIDSLSEEQRAALEQYLSRARDAAELSGGSSRADSRDS